MCESAGCNVRTKKYVFISLLVSTVTEIHTHTHTRRQSRLKTQQQDEGSLRLHAQKKNQLCTEEWASLFVL